jgi:integrase/recombinase XerD
MFDQLFERSHALVRQRSAPLADERRRYVLHCIEQGMARSTVRLVAELLIGVERCLKLSERPNSIISLQEIEEAGTRWASRKAGATSLRPELSRQRFIREAARWLTFMDRLQPPSRSTKPYDNRIVEFADFMLHERGLSAATIEQRCHTVRQFLDQLCERERGRSWR